MPTNGCQDLLREVTGHPFVGIDNQHPLPSGLIETEVLLSAVTRPLLEEYPGTCLLREVPGSIGTARVHNDDLVHPTETVQTRAEMALLVQRNDHGRHQHPVHPNTKK